MPVPPQVRTYERQRIGERGAWLGVPCRGAHRQRALSISQAHGEQRDDREECENQRCRSRDRLLRPLSLRLEPEMPARFLECDLDLPASHVVLENLCSPKL